MLRLLNIQEICPLKRFIFTSKCTKMRLVAGLHLDPLGELTVPPDPSWIKGEGKGRESKGEGEEGKGRTPPISEVCWCQWLCMFSWRSQVHSFVPDWRDRFLVLLYWLTDTECILLFQLFSWRSQVHSSVPDWRDRFLVLLYWLTDTECILLFQHTWLLTEALVYKIVALSTLPALTTNALNVTVHALKVGHSPRLEVW